MKFCYYFSAIAVFIAAFLTLSTCQGETCGGLLEADAGEYEFPPQATISPGQVCVWVIKLISRETIRFNLKQLGSGLTVSLYPEHSPSQISIQPTRLAYRDAGRTIDRAGQTLVVVLTGASNSSSGRGLSLKWDSLLSASAATALITAANYIAKESGHVIWNRFSNRERLTLSVNAEQNQALDVEANGEFRECNLINNCECSYVALYEIRSDGYLRTVSIACGRNSQVKVEKLFPNLLAFVYLNSSNFVGSSDYTEIKWSVSLWTPPNEYETSPASTTDASWSTWTTSSPFPSTSSSEWMSSTASPTTELPRSFYSTTGGYSSASSSSHASPGCGGVVDVYPDQDSYIEFLPPGGYKNNEFCVWILSPKTNSYGFYISLENLGIEENFDGIVIYTWTSSPASIDSRKILQHEYTHRWITDEPFAAIAFSSDSSVTSLGFRASVISTDYSPVAYQNSAFLLTENSGSFRYPPYVGNEVLNGYEPNEEVAIVVKSHIHSSQSVDVIFTNIADDTLAVYEFGNYHGSTDFARLIGRTTGFNYNFNPGGVPGLSSVSRFPRLIIFSSNPYNSGIGFIIRWKAHFSPFSHYSSTSDPTSTATDDQSGIQWSVSTSINDYETSPLSTPQTSWPTWTTSSPSPSSPSSEGMSSTALPTTELPTSFTSTTDSYTSPSSLPSTSPGCGGVVSVNPYRQRTIEFLPPGGYKNNEVCVWILSPKSKSTGFQIHVENLGIEAIYDGIVIYSWTSATESIQARKIWPHEYQDTFTICQPYAAIVFSSDETTTSLGFRASVISTGYSAQFYPHKEFLFNTISGEFNYPRDVGNEGYYKANERVSIVIKSHTLSSQSVNLTYTHIADDTIAVYELRSYQRRSDFARHIGSLDNMSPDYNYNNHRPGGIPRLSSISNFPRLILFSSNRWDEGLGFSIRWNGDFAPISDYTTSYSSATSDYTTSHSSSPSWDSSPTSHPSSPTSDSSATSEYTTSDSSPFSQYTTSDSSATSEYTTSDYTTSDSTTTLTYTTSDSTTTLTYTTVDYSTTSDPSSASTEFRRVNSRRGYTLSELNEKEKKFRRWWTLANDWINGRPRVEV